MIDSEMCYVIGSGPAGIACAQGLVAAGRQVTILDPGLQLESERKSACASLAASTPSEWTPTATSFLKEGTSASAAGIPLKRSYGSDFPYRKVSGALSIVNQGTETIASYARGGLSTVWGGAVMPYRQEDIADWPISVADLEPGYRAVLEWMPLSARRDQLLDLFPLYADRISPLPMSRQAASLLGGLERSRAKLKSHGIHFGSSRLSVNACDPEGRPLCVQCGLCLYGCPHSLIYSTDQTLGTLLATGRIRYQPGVAAQRVEESDSGVLIHGIDSTNRAVQFRGSRVFLGAGTLNTIAILLRSLQRYETPVPIRDSPFFLLPLLRIRGAAGVVGEPLHTLSQLFLEIVDTAISPFTIHVQTYTYNDLFRRALVDQLGPLKSILPLEAILGRLFMFLTHFHSLHSAPITATLQRDSGGDTLHLQATANPETSRCVKRLLLKFVKLIPQTGLIPIGPALNIAKPLRSFHFGGSFPMSAHPGTMETDIWGRPAGWKRVHAIDSTVLPSIAATTIALTVMANAYRIGSRSGLYAN